MASRDFQIAILAQAARNLLEASIPIGLNEIFVDDGMMYGQKLSRSMQKVLMDKLYRDGVVSERSHNNPKWEAKNIGRLIALAIGCPPTVSGDEEMYHYLGKEAEKRARVAVAIRALKRLVASDEHPETASSMPARTLFVAKKGDKHQQKQVWNKNWQESFLDQIVKQGSLVRTDEGDGLITYSINNKDYIQAVIDNRAKPCVETLLWPENPCPIDHVSHPPDVKAILGEAMEESKSEPETKGEDPLTKVKQEVKAILDTVPKEERAETLKEAIKTAEKEAFAADGDEEISVKEALNTLLDIFHSVSDAVMTQGKCMDTQVKLSTKLVQEVDHLHSKMDKIHEENMTLRGDLSSSRVTIDSILGLVTSINKTLDPSDSSLNAIRKRLGDIEKIASEHKVSLEASNKLLKTGLAEAASSMVTQAAKVFVQQDHSEVLTKMQSVEENIIEVQSKTTKVLGEVYEALDKVRAEYKSSNRAPIILQRMEAISEELQHLQALLPDLPAAMNPPDLSGV